MKRIPVKKHIQNVLCNHIPSLELCNDYIYHHKVHTLKYIEYSKFIPRGKHLYIWFKHNYSRNINQCYLLSIKKKKVVHMEEIQISFNKFLTLGCGTMFHAIEVKENSFVIQDILYFKGEPMNLLHYRMRLQKILYTLEYGIHEKRFFTTYQRPNKVSMKQVQLPYEVSHVEYVSQSGVSYLVKVKYQPMKNQYIITADLQNDIYHMYSLSNKYVGILNIPDYKTSCMMNSLFRHIRENDNLDYIEESEDEEDFQNISEDKYVNTSLKYVFECEYLHKFKMWKPIRKIKSL